MRTTTLFLMITIVIGGTALAGWDPASKSKAERRDKERREDAAEAIKNFRETDHGMKRFFENAYGYAVFPKVGKGGFGIGGAHGKGFLYRNDEIVGRTTLSQVTVGFQAGGQVYSEIIFFKDAKHFDDFKSGNFEFSAQASAVAVTEGASANAGYNDGVAVFTLARGGLMYEASVGGQKFTFEPLGNEPAGSADEGEEKDADDDGDEEQEDSADDETDE